MTTLAPAAPAQPLLTALDRCDACHAARAYVKVILDVSMQGDESALLLCGHHWNKHKTKLLEVALDHHDETHLITVDRRAAGTSAFV